MSSFRCVTDGDFDISGDCLADFRGLDLATRHRVLNRAIKNCAQEGRPYISRSVIKTELMAQRQGVSG